MSRHKSAGRPNSQPVRNRDDGITSGPPRSASETETVALASLAAQCRDLTAYRDRLSQILDNLPMPVWLRAKDLSLTWVNQAHRVAVEVDVGVTPSEQNLELVPGLDADEAQVLARRAIEKGQPQAERWGFVVGGNRRSFELVEIPVGTGEVVGFAHDITERDDAVGELESYSDASAEMFSRLQSAVAIFNVERHLTFHNDAFVRLWKFDESWLELHPGHDEILENLRQRRLFPEQIDFLAYKNAIFDQYTSLLEPHEEMEVLPDGTIVRSVLSPHPMGGLMIVFDDVTDRLEMERARNTTDAVQRNILDHLREGVAVYGSDGRLKLYNAGFRECWGLADEFLGSEPHVSEVVEACRTLIFDASASASEWVSLKERIIENALEREPRTSRLHLTDGRTIHCSGKPLPDGPCCTRTPTREACLEMSKALWHPIRAKPYCNLVAHRHGHSVQRHGPNNPQML
ncbi:MAG: hypothetical protein CL569_09880 [Alphaproteobacteria bacterium]|nr:hypothetical protein [Alphaproteobacteria bacterium]